MPRLMRGFIHTLHTVLSTDILNNVIFGRAFELRTGDALTLDEKCESERLIEKHVCGVYLQILMFPIRGTRAHVS